MLTWSLIFCLIMGIAVLLACEAVGIEARDYQFLVGFAAAAGAATGAWFGKRGRVKDE
jgi:hypothetical protein